MITGSREFNDMASAEKKIKGFISKLDGGVTVVHGGANGADTWAMEAAIEAKLAVEEHPADWLSHGKSAGPVRNLQMVNDSDVVVAFWNGRSKGTFDAITKAKSAGKLLAVFVI